MSRRFFLDSPPVAGVAQLTGPEAQHVAKVLRARIGDELVLFDGSGVEYDAVVTALGRGDVECRITAIHAIDREALRRVHLAVAMPKGDRGRLVIEKAVELGIARLTPLETARGVVEPGAGALERWRRGVIEAAKQCGRNRLMEVAPPQSLAAWLAEQPEGGLLLLAHPRDNAPPAARILAEQFAHGDSAEPCRLLIGPEGGWTDDEVAQVEAAGGVVASLGPRILRVETAVAALATLAVLGGP